MNLHENFQPSVLHFNKVIPSCMDNCAFSPPFPSTDNSPDISSSMDYLETIFSDEYMDFPVHVDELYADSLIDDFPMDLDEFDCIFNEYANGIPKMLDETEENDQSLSDGFHERYDHDHDHAMRTYEASMDMMVPSMHPSLVLPFPGMEVDPHLCLDHLLTAYAEAMDTQENELSEVITQRVIKKVGPLGGTTERLLYYMFQDRNREPDHLTQESLKNFYLAFKAFYQVFPYGKFAHFVANSAILEALPNDVEIIHLIDFDIGDGLQWASLIEAIKHQDKEIRVTSVNINEDDKTSPFRWRFEETKRRLCDHAKSHGVKIRIEEARSQDLESTTTNIKKGDYRKKSWYVFNVHVGLPHMGRARSRKDVLEFLRLAKHFLHHHVPHYRTSKGIITYVDGDTLHKETATSYSSFLHANLVHYRAMLESMESDFPSHLGEARLALECLFMGPNASAAEWGRKWEERRHCGGVELGVGLEGLAWSEAILGEAKQVVREGVSMYGVRIEGEKKNEMVMEWNGVPMLRVCCWKS